jgi:hypothetical protein
MAVAKLPTLDQDMAAATTPHRVPEHQGMAGTAIQEVPEATMEATITPEATEAATTTITTTTREAMEATGPALIATPPVLTSTADLRRGTHMETVNGLPFSKHPTCRHPGHTIPLPIAGTVLRTAEASMEEAREATVAEVDMAAAAITTAVHPASQQSAS